MNILIVDDSQVIRKMYISILNRLFEHTQLNIYEASTGKEGLEKFYELKHIDLILLDVNMPEMQGDEVLRIIRANPLFNTVKIILSTTEGRKEFVQEMIKAGANSYIVKPFNAKKAENAIRIAYRRLFAQTDTPAG